MHEANVKWVSKTVGQETGCGCVLQGLLKSE